MFYKGITCTSYKQTDANLHTTIVIYELQENHVTTHSSKFKYNFYCAKSVN